MNEVLSRTLVLAAIGAISALLLGLVNNVTEPVIAERSARELEMALTDLAGSGTPGTGENSPVEGVVTRWPVSDGGWIVEIVGKGYGGPMRLLAAYDPDGTLRNAKLVENNETPGLGKNAENPVYMKKFIGTGGDLPVPTTRGDLAPELDDVTGATVTFNGVSRALAEGSAWAREWGVSR